MKKILAISLGILLASTISFAASPVGKGHFYGEWTAGEKLTYIYSISANSFKAEVIEYTSIGIPFKANQPLLKWEYAKNPNKTLNANFPDGYLIRTKRGDGNPAYFYLWRHYKNNNIIMYQPDEFFLEGKYDILKKSVPFKQADYYGDWNSTDGVSVDNVSITTISADKIMYSSIENGKPIKFNFPILRWEAIKNPDESSIADFPDGYMVSTESAGGHPKTAFLWRKSKSNDMILFQPLDGENSLLLVRAKSKIQEEWNFEDARLSQGYGKLLTDGRDGKKYKTVAIGTQTWMAENLNYAASGSKCYDNNLANCDKYGRLYNWYTAIKVCPSGWHLPSNEEWGVLMKFVDSSGEKLKARSGWNLLGSFLGKGGSLSGAGTDVYGFAALAGGMGASANNFKGYDYFDYVGESGTWWSTSDGIEVNRASCYGMNYNSNYADRYRNYKDDLLSVRCLRN